jgi:hypothetical protein
VSDFVPRQMVSVPGANAWLNVRQPLVPIRGWIMQQLVKLRAATELDVDILLLADSDVRLVRAITTSTFQLGERTRFFCSPTAVTASMSRHRRWHQVAHDLLQLGPVGSPPLADYISPFNVWDRRVVLALKEKVESRRRRSWLDEIGGQLHFSEFILYGVFVDLILGETAPVAPTSVDLCHCYWETRPLSPLEAKQFVAGVDDEDVAVMISAKSHTPMAIRRAAFGSFAAARVDADAGAHA